MDPFRGLGMPRIPGLTELLSLLQTQTEALAQLPRTLSDLNGTVRELTEVSRRFDNAALLAALPKFDFTREQVLQVLDEIRGER